jgi:Tol biopolymer transport system component/predicted Ser/Thr protein kinase
MTPDRLQRAFELFDAATALPEEERELFLTQECGADGELRDDVRSLLSAHREAEGFLSGRTSRMGIGNVPKDDPALPALGLGTRLGSFAIEGFVGAGGMGEVYKARDTRLDRHVAIKVLRSDIAADPSSRARFSFEARAIARLSHPRICAIHDVAHHEGIDFLVMEFLDGETLAHRLRRKGLSLAEAIRTALEIAEALSAAHARGIVHRDLKPGNVMLTPTGARLLDFGLARLKADAGPAGDSRTITVTGADDSAAGLIAGTLHYMAPEQLEGKPVDARADIFAFGVVLYEMITRRKAFEGSTTAGVITAILTSEPPSIAAAMPLVPLSLERLIRACLVKDRDRRWASIHDVLVQLEWIAGDTSNAAVPATRGATSRARLAWIVAASMVAAAAVSGALWWNLRRLPANAGMLVLSVSPPEGVVLAAESPPAISADGRRLAFVATDPSGRQLLYHQTLDSHDDARPIANTDGALFPFWAPDQSRIGFFADGQLKVVHIAAARVQSLAAAGQPRGGTWNDDDVIVFVPRPLDGFYRISASGGEALPLKLNVPPGAPGWYPSFLPDGRHLLVYVPSPQDPDKARVAMISLDADTRTDLVSGTRSNAVFAAPGHLLFWRDGTLMAHPFDAATLRLHGNALALPSSAGLNRLTNQALFSVSGSGTLVLFGDAAGQTRLEWIDRSGTRAGTAGPTGVFNTLSLAPDDTKVVYDESAARTGSVDLHRLDFVTGQTVRLTFNAAHDMFPLWSRDGRRIFFNSLRSIPPELFEIDADSTGDERQVLNKGFPTIPNDVSSDGRLLIYQGIRPATNGDVFAVALDAGREEVPVLETRANEGHAMLSPDGKLLAYISNEARRYEVFVRQFPWAEGGRQWQISADGGFEPYWRSDGKELFFLAPNRTLMSVELTGTGSSFRHGPPRALFPTHVTWLENQAIGRHYAPSRDGQRFLIANATDRARTMPITVVLNWAAGLADDRLN